MTSEDATPTTADLWELVQRQASKLAELEAELERQRVEKVSLASRLTEVEGGHGPAERKLSRAGLLKAAAAGAAGLAAGVAVGNPQLAFAGTDGDVILSSTSNTGTSETEIQAGPLYPSTAVFRADASTNSNTGNIDGVQAQGSGIGSGLTGQGGSAGGRGVTGFGGGTSIGSQGPGVVGLGYGSANPLDPLGAMGVAGYSTGNVGVYGETTSNYGVWGYAVQGGTGVKGDGGYGGRFSGDKAVLNLALGAGPIPPPLADDVYETGDIFVANGGGLWATLWLCTKGGQTGTWVPLMHGNSNDGTNDTLLTAVSTQQYSLSNSDGVTWVTMDGTNLSLTITPKQNSLAILTGNSDLWTSQAGYNQDIGIMVSGGAYPTHAGQPEAWKESGGFAGTYSPNAAFVQTVVPLVAGTAYTIKLVWKANKSATGATIWAGAGPIGGKFSPTRLTVLLIPTS
jgi:hypothetical protein